ncbi:MAG TPA: hypothetical protein VNO21_18295, partial [Polyangiaceae bacterium]|nr:hypothetical protein [Polyangiaceae bacterium]
DELAHISRKRDQAMLGELDPQAAPDAYARAVGTEGERARAEAFYKDRAALGRRYARWFPPAPPAGSADPAFDDGRTPEEEEDEEAVFVALSAVAEVIAVAGGLELDRQADAILLLDKLLPDGQLTPAVYAQVIGSGSPRIASALAAVQTAVTGK